MKTFTIKLTGFFLTGFLLFLLLGTYWGMWGKIGTKHFDLLLNSLLPWQKKELASEMNHYYNQDFISRNTTGLIFSCKPTTESIKKQFNWFYRNAISAAFTDSPDYDTLVRSAWEASGDDTIKPPSNGTFDYELALTEKFKTGKYPFFTRKDAIGWGLTAVSFGVKLVAWTINPLIGASLTLIGIGQAGLSDMNKAVPGIITFMQIRCRNFIYSLALLWGISGFFILRSKTQKTKSSGKKSNSKASTSKKKNTKASSKKSVSQKQKRKSSSHKKKKNASK